MSTFPRARALLGLVTAGALVAAGLILPAAAQAAPVLLSQGKTATASSTENTDYLAARYAVDGDTGTRWASAANDAEWLQVDLGQTSHIERVDLRWEAAYGKNYAIQVSNDGSSWTTINSRTGGTGGNESLAVSGDGRYVRFLGQARGTGYGYSLWEFQVFGSAGSTPTDPTTPTNPAACDDDNVAAGKTTSASSTEGGGDQSKLAADGNAGTRWSSAWSDNQWWQVDLGASTSVCGVTLNWEAAYGKTFQVQVSDSPSSGFTTIATVTNGTGGANQVVAASGKGRYLRLNLQTRATGYGFSLWEVTVSTPSGSTTPTDPTDPTTPTGDLYNPRIPDGPNDGKVKVAGSQGNWALQVDGKQWVVKGMTWGPAISEFAGHVANLKAMGVNTIRTWGTDAGSKTLFDQAAANGIRVIAGFWLAPGGGPGSGGCPDYVNDAAYKSTSMNDILTQVRAYKDNPGVLMWDVGNESLLGLGSCGTVGGGVEANRNAYAKFVNDVAVEIKKIDPNHPVTSTDAWTGAWPYLKANTPALDLYGLNSYGAVCSTKQTWVSGGYTKPYILTEGGPVGSWEADPDVNGIPNQGTDQDNANGYVKSWNCLGQHNGVALGATMFHYGTEGDFGGIWFNVIPGGNKRLSYYAIAKMYGGSAGNAGVNTPPTFQSMSIDNSTSIVAGATVTLRAAVSDPQGDPINYVTFVNSQPINDAGGLQWVEHTRNGNVFTFTAPQALGVWKAYLFAEDGKGNVGVQTVSFRVVPPAVSGTNIAKGKTATASSFDPWNGNWTPGQAVDGDYTTRWSSNWSDNEWIQVDLGSKQSFRTIQLVWEAAYAKGYLVQTSDNGSTWTTLSTVANGDGGVDTLNVDGSARYVRLQGVTRGTAYGYSLYELGIYS